MDFEHSDYLRQHKHFLYRHASYVATQQEFLLEQSLKIKGCLGRQRGDFPLVEKVTIQGLILSIGGAISYELLSGRNVFVVNLH